MSGYYGNTYDRYVERNDTSTIHQMKKAYWNTKQTVIRKLGKKEDEHVVASDHELDAKIEVFRAIQDSCMSLLQVIENYQDRICGLSQEENAMGRFLKTHSSADKTRAGKMMAAVGKSQSFSSQQRLALRVPLVRLYQEVETFRYRAISDTLLTINKMEASRTKYRAALMWMKDASDELDPDTYKQLEKFRTVQTQVKKEKAKFDKLKLDTMQKIDLLAASRCNMFSHVLANYQSTLLHFWDKTSRTMSAVQESFKGYQYYEFNMLKELQEPNRQLAEETKKPAKDDRDQDTDEEKPARKKLISFGDNEEETPSGADQNNHRLTQDQEDEVLDLTSSDFLEYTDEPDDKLDLSQQKLPLSKHPKPKNDDLVSGDLVGGATDSAQTTEADDMTLLNEILNAPSTGGDDFTREWNTVFGDDDVTAGLNLDSRGDAPAEGDNMMDFMPSHLLDINQHGGVMGGMAGMNLGPQQQPFGMAPGGDMSQQQQHMMQQALLPGQQQPQQSAASGAPPAPTSKDPSGQAKKQQKTDMSAWFSLFADLDPLSNPDAVGRQDQAAGDAL